MLNTTEKGNDVESVQKDQGEMVAFGVCNTYATILTKFWYVICIIIFTMMAAYGTIAFTLYDLPDFLDPVKGFDARGTVIAARLKSLSNMLYHSDDYLSQQTVTPESGGDGNKLIDPSLDEPQLSCHYPGPEPATNSSQSTIWFGASLWNWDERVAKVIFEGVDGRDMLSASSVKSVCTAEVNFITSHPLYQTSCFCHAGGLCPSTWSLGNYIALLSNKTSCQNITDDDVSHVSMLLKQCAPVFHNRSRADLQEDEASVLPAECIQHDYAIHTILFFLLPWDFSEGIIRNETVKADVSAVFFPIQTSQVALETVYKDNLQGCSCSDGITELKAVDFSLKFTLFSSLLLADSVFLGIGIIVIFILIWAYTGSFIITVAALLNIVFSLLMAYFFYNVVFARPFFPFSNILAAVLIIGIGADDAFVFIDLWKKCKSEIGGNDLVALTRETLRHATTTMFVTSFTTAAALYASIISDITAVKCFGVFAGTAILMNLILTLSLTPAFAVLDHKLTFWVNCLIYKRGKEGRKDRDRTQDHNSNSCWQRFIILLRGFFEKMLPSFVLRLRYIWIVFYLLLGVGAAIVIFYMPGVQLPSVSENQFLIISHHFEQFDFVYKDMFAFSNKNRPYVSGYIVWGVEAVDNGNIWDPDDSGIFSPREDFTFSSPSDQEWLLEFCQDLRNQSFFKSDGPYDCFIERMKSLMELPCVADPLTGQDWSPCCEQSTFPFPSSVFDVCLGRFQRAGYIPSVRFRKNDSAVAVITVPFTMDYKQSLSYAVNDELWISANTWVESKLKSAPSNLQHGWFVPFTLDIGFYDLQKSLASGTTLSMLVTLGVGSVIVLLSIQNLLLTINAMVTITSTVFVTAAVLVLIGWELNIVESTIVTLSVGLSVDFTLHYGVAYRLAPHLDRKSRGQYSLSTMSGAISIAALSTFVAGALVTPATVYGYTQFGIFLMIVMTVSWTYSTFFFQSLCYVIGPQKSTGDLPCSSCCDCFGYSNGQPSPEIETRERGRGFTPKDPSSLRNTNIISNGRFLPIRYSDYSVTAEANGRSNSKRNVSVHGGFETNSNRVSLVSDKPQNPSIHSEVYSSVPHSKRTLLNDGIQLGSSEVYYNPVFSVHIS